jgi:hypothetical protein
MASANVFIKIFLTSEALTRVSIAVGIRTEECCFGGAILLVYFPLMA